MGAPLGGREALEIEEMEKKRFAKPERAMSAVTPEDLAFEAELQRMHVEQQMPDQVDGVPTKLTQEEARKELLSDVVEGTMPASSLADLEQQVFLAKGHGCNAIEADEKVIRYFTRGSFDQTVANGFFMYKDIKVFVPGKFRGHVRTDKLSIHDKVFGNSKIK